MIGLDHTMFKLNQNNMLGLFVVLINRAPPGNLLLPNHAQRVHQRGFHWGTLYTQG